MAIEFQCNRCGAALRAPDGTEGKKAKCKSCGAIVSVVAHRGTQSLETPKPSALPGGGASQPGFPPSFASPPPRVESPLGPLQEPVAEFPDFSQPAAAPVSTNPFAAPLGMTGGRQTLRPEADGRDGPPWEREGKSISSLWATFLCAHRSRDFLFDQMRRDGGLGAPLAFALLCLVPVMAEYALYWISMVLTIFVAAPPELQLQSGMMIFSFIYQMMKFPALAVVFMFITAAV